MHLVFLLYALFGSIFTIGKYALDTAQPFFIVGSRMTVAGILLLAYMAFKERSNFNLDRFAITRLIALGFFNIFLCNACEFWGLQYLTSGKTCLLYSVSPFISALLSYFILSEVMNKRKWLGLVAGFIGFLPIIMEHSSSEESVGTLLVFSYPELALLTAATCSVYGWIIIRQLIQERGLNPLFINGFSMLLGGAFTLVWSYIQEDWNPVPIFDGKHLAFFQSTLAMLLISNFICYNLYGYLLKTYSATFMSFAGFSTPIFVVLFGWIFLDETVPWQFWMSLGVVFCSLFIYHKEELGENFIHNKVEELKKSV